MKKANKMHQVYVGIGSNIDREKHIRAAIHALQQVYGPKAQLQVSPVYETRAVGFEGEDFYNLVACFYTSESAFEVEQQLKAIEHQNGRHRQTGKSPQLEKSTQSEKSLQLEISTQPVKNHPQAESPQQEKFSSRTLDIDLLLFDDQVLHSQGINIPRDEIEKYAFVLAPLADLAPELIHPTKGKSIATMWDTLIHDQPELAHSLNRITFKWT